MTEKYDNEDYDGDDDEDYDDDDDEDYDDDNDDDNNNDDSVQTTWYVCLDSFQISLDMVRSSLILESITRQLISHSSAVLCITIRDKGATPQSTFQAVYPQNIITTTAGDSELPNRDTIQDTILHEESFTLDDQIYANLVYSSPTSYLMIENKGIIHLVFYALLPLPMLDKNDTHTVQISAYIKVPRDGGSDPGNRGYIPLFDTKTNQPYNLVKQFSTKLLFVTRRIFENTIWERTDQHMQK